MDNERHRKVQCRFQGADQRSAVHSIVIQRSVLKVEIVQQGPTTFLLSCSDLEPPMKLLCHIDEAGDRLFFRAPCGDVLGVTWFSVWERLTPENQLAHVVSCVAMPCL